MAFFNKKYDVLDIELTPYGRHLLQNGRLMPKYYAFFDDDIIYDPASAGFTEKNSDVKNRIINETPVLRSHYSFKDLEKQQSAGTLYQDVKKSNADETAKYLQYSLGTSDPAKEKAPAWEIFTIKNEISSSTNRLSSSTYQSMNIPQLEFDINYEISIGNINEKPDGRGLTASPDQQVGEIMPDGTFVNVVDDQVLLHILEKNGFLYGDALEVEVFEYETTEVAPLAPIRAKTVLTFGNNTNDLGLPGNDKTLSLTIGGDSYGVHFNSGAGISETVFQSDDLKQEIYTGGTSVTSGSYWIATYVHSAVRQVVNKNKLRRSYKVSAITPVSVVTGSTIAGGILPSGSHSFTIEAIAPGSVYTVSAAVAAGNNISFVNTTGTNLLTGSYTTFTEELKALTFIKREQQIVNGILITEEADGFNILEDSAKITPGNVEYYFDCRLDKEIPIRDLCDGIQKLKSSGAPVDFDIECPDVKNADVGQFSIYDSKITDAPEDC